MSSNDKENFIERTSDEVLLKALFLCCCASADDHEEKLDTYSKKHALLIANRLLALDDDHRKWLFRQKQSCEVFEALIQETDNLLLIENIYNNKHQNWSDQGAAILKKRIQELTRSGPCYSFGDRFRFILRGAGTSLFGEWSEADQLKLLRWRGNLSPSLAQALDSELKKREGIYARIHETSAKHAEGKEKLATVRQTIAEIEKSLSDEMVLATEILRKEYEHKHAELTNLRDQLSLLVEDLRSKREMAQQEANRHQKFVREVIAQSNAFKKYERIKKEIVKGTEDLSGFLKTLEK
jgi:hypothetical protein